MDGLGFLAGGLGQGLAQGFNNANLNAIRQSYLKMQMQQQEFMQKMAQENLGMKKQQQELGPLAAALRTMPQAGGAIGPAMQGILHPESAQYYPTAGAEQATPPDMSLLERPEEQPTRGQVAVPSLISEAYKRIGAAGEENVAFQRSMKQQQEDIHRMTAESAMRQREFQEWYKMHPAGSPGGPVRPMSPVEAKDLRAVIDYYDTALSAKEAAESGELPFGGKIRGGLNMFGGQVNALLGRTGGGLGENPELTAASKWFKTNLLDRAKTVGGVRAAGSPTEFKVMESISPNLESMGPESLKSVTETAYGMAERALNNYREQLAARGMDTSIIDKHVPQRISVDEIKGHPRKPQAIMGDAYRNVDPLGTSPLPPPSTWRPIQ